MLQWTGFWHQVTSHPTTHIVQTSQDQVMHQVHFQAISPCCCVQMGDKANDHFDTQIVMQYLFEVEMPL